MKREYYLLEVECHDLNVMFDAIVAIDLEKKVNAQIGSSLDVKSILPCLMSAARVFEIINFPFSVKDSTGKLSDSVLENIRDNLDKVTNVTLGGTLHRGISCNHCL